MQNSDPSSSNVETPDTTEDARQPEPSSVGDQLKEKTKTKKAPAIKKIDTKVLSSTHDDDYLSSDEESDLRQGGRKTLPLLLTVSKNCRKVDEPEKKLVRCIGSTGCGKTWIRPRDKTRILKHVMSCGYVAKLPGGSLLIQQAIQALAVKAPGLLDDLTKRIEQAGSGTKVTEKRQLVDESSAPRKHNKIDFSCQGDTSDPKLSIANNGYRISKSFSSANYQDIYETILELISQLKTSQYHKKKWDEARKKWAQKGM